MEWAKYVLVSDTALAREHNNFPLLDFLPCAPSGTESRSVYNFLKGSSLPAVYGRALLAPYAPRKLEAALVMRHRTEEIVVPHEDYIEEFVKEDTEVIGVYTMDPLGLGPLTMSYVMLFSDQSKPWVRMEFEELMARLNRTREGTRAKLAV